GRESGAIRLDRHLEPLLVQRLDDRRVKLEERFAARADHERAGAARRVVRPERGDRPGEVLRANELAPALAVRADEVGVAKLTDGLRAALLAPGPEVAARKSAEDGRPTRVCPLPLKGIEDLLDRVVHAVACASLWYGAGSLLPFSAKPLSRNRQASH